MEELIKRLERVIQTGVQDKNGMHPISAETVLEVVKEQLGTNLASLGMDCISRQAAIDALLGITAMRNTIPLDSAIFNIKKLPSAQPEIVRCKDCKHYQYGICKKAGLCVNKSPNGFCDWGDMRGEQDENR